MRTASRRRFRDLLIGHVALVATAAMVSTAIWLCVGHIQSEWRAASGLHEELAWEDTVVDSLQDQEDALNDYLSTRDPRYLPPYQNARRRFDSALSRLTQLVADDPAAADRRDVETAHRLIDAWTTGWAQPQLVAVAAGRPAPAAAVDAARLVQGVRAALEELRENRLRALGERNAQLDMASSVARGALVVGALAALGFVILILARSARQLVHERRLAETAARQLRDALEQAHAAERAKTRFLANVSHEMRTPLNAVTGLVDALAGTPLVPEQRELLEAIQFSSATLDHLIGDLLSLSRDARAIGQTHVETRFNLRDAVRAIARPFAAEAEAKGLEFVVDADEMLAHGVTGDAGSLSQLLACLLSNAVKFTEAGGVRLSVRALPDDRYAFEVADTGIGFDEVRKAELFQLFSQSDDSETRRYTGAGLGLPRAGQLAAELRGVLEAHSTPGAGSRFRFEIPLGSARAPAAAMAGGREPLRVLIVDDNTMNRKVLELILDQVGVAWESVENGQLAVDAVRHGAFAAILMDMHMPVMDGLTATREIRALESETGRPATPVIVVSANSQPEHMEAGRAAGAQRFLGKPISAQALIDTLNEVFDALSEAA